MKSKREEELEAAITTAISYLNGSSNKSVEEVYDILMNARDKEYSSPSPEHREITDEEILNNAEETLYHYPSEVREGFISGAQWYRSEQKRKEKK